MPVFQPNVAPPGVSEFIYSQTLDGGSVDLRNIIARDFLQRRKRNADDDILVEQFIDFDEDEDNIINQTKRRRPGGSNSRHRPVYEDSTWGKMLRDQHSELLLPESDAARIFRRRFRIPYTIFLELLGWTKEWHEKSTTDASGRARIPTELKLLGVLRILGRATCFDGIFELSGISISTMQSFFHEFTKWFRAEVYPKHVYTPNTYEELVEIEGSYSYLGLPGAIGSMDVVHIAWCMCPAYLSNLATGKEGYPSIAYNVICDHNGRAIAVLPGAYGSINDKTIVRFDDFVDDVRCLDFFTKFEYNVRTGARLDDHEMLAGAWIIVDGGYHKWEVTQAASKIDQNPFYAQWRTQMESVRKDIECFFGRLKARFRLLKTPVSFHKKIDIDNAFFTCVGLQNMLHDWDTETGRLASWNVDAHFTDPEGQFHDEDGTDDDEARFWCRPKLRKAQKRNEFFVPEPCDDFSDCGTKSFPLGVTRVVGHQEPCSGETSRYYAKQEKLVEHYKQVLASNSERRPWLRS